MHEWSVCALEYAPEEPSPFQKRFCEEGTQEVLGKLTWKALQEARLSESLCSSVVKLFAPDGTPFVNKFDSIYGDQINRLSILVCHLQSRSTHPWRIGKMIALVRQMPRDHPGLVLPYGRSSNKGHNILKQFYVILNTRTHTSRSRFLIINLPSFQFMFYLFMQHFYLLFHFEHLFDLFKREGKSFLFIHF